MSHYNLFDRFRTIPVKRPNSPHRRKADVTGGFVTHNALKIIISGKWFRDHKEFEVGDHILVGFDGDREMLIVPAENGEPNARKISKHPTDKEAGVILLSAICLPEDFPHWDERLPIKTEVTEDGVVLLQLPAVGDVA